MRRPRGCRKVIGIVVLLSMGLPSSLLAQPTPATAAEPAPEPSPEWRGRIEGRLLTADGKNAVPGAVVRACALEGETVISSKPSDPRGEFRLDGLPLGYTDLTVETSEGLFVVNQVLQVLPSGRMVLDLVLNKFADRPSSWWEGRERPQAPPCSGQQPVGSADVREKRTAKEFAKSPAGIGLIAGGVGALLLLAATGGGSESSASPSQP